MDMTVAATVVFAAESNLSVAVNACIVKHQDDESVTFVWGDKAIGTAMAALMVAATMLGKHVDRTDRKNVFTIDGHPVHVFSQAGGFKQIPGYYDLTVNMKVVPQSEN